MDKEITEIMKSNNWEYAYSVGYYHGKKDAENNIQSQGVKRSEKTDFAWGYVQGYGEIREMQEIPYK
jgi:ribosomal protein L18